MEKQNAESTCVSSEFHLQFIRRLSLRREARFAQGCAKVYQACKVADVLFCIRKHLSFCWFPNILWLKRVPENRWGVEGLQRFNSWTCFA